MSVLLCVCACVCVLLPTKTGCSPVTGNERLFDKMSVLVCVCVRVCVLFAFQDRLQFSYRQ
jgi:hypothetical protein